MSNDLNKEYQEELDKLKEKMIEAQKFAEKFPSFKQTIIERKITGEGSVNFGDRYKTMPFGWGAYRHFYRSKDDLTNYRKDIEPMYLTRIYINTLNLYDLHENFDLEKMVCEKTDIFFFDSLNTTFLLTDEQLEPFLEVLHDWYVAAKEKAATFKKEIRKKKLEDELKELGERRS